MINLPEDAQAAIDAGADKMAVTQRYLEAEGQKAIQAGADPEAVKQRTVDMLGSMVPQQDVDAQGNVIQAPSEDDMAIRDASKKIRGQVSSFLGGAGVGLAQGVNKVKQNINNLVPGNEEANVQLAQQNERMGKQFQQLDMPQDNPEATQVGMAVGREALPMAAALGVGGGASKLGTKAVGHLPEAIQKGASLFSEMFAGSVAMGAGTAVRGEGDIAEDMVTGAWIPLAFRTAGKAVSSLANSDAVKRTLARIPLVGIKGKMTKIGNDIASKGKDLLKKHGYMNGESTSAVSKRVWKDLNDAMTGRPVVVSKKVTNILQNKIDKVRQTMSGKYADDLINGYQDGLNSLKGNLSMEGLHEMRSSLYGKMFGKTGTQLGDKATKKVQNALKKAFSEALEDTAKAAGKSGEFRAANYVYQKNLLAKDTNKILSELGDEGADKLDDVMAVRNKLLNYVKEDGKQVPAALRKEFTEEVKGWAKLVNSNKVAAETLKKRGNMPSVGNVASGAGAVGLGMAAGIPAGATLATMGVGAFALSTIIKNPVIGAATRKFASEPNIRLGLQILEAIAHESQNTEEQR
jgi:hypothetical protein